MNNLISLYGTPAQNRIDQGKEFDNNILRNLLNSLNINVKVGYSHNHQDNTRKQQLTWSGPLEVTKIVNNTMQ